MSTTLPLPGPATAAHGYALAVRAELADLPAEVVEELTGGLEADLAELAAESSTPLAERLGDPRAYAAELRSSAGLPAAAAATAAAPRAGLWARATEGAREDVQHAVAHLRSRSWWPGSVERAHQLRPAWWVARGLVGGWVLASLLGVDGFARLLLLLAAAAASVELARRTWTGRWSRPALVAGNVLAVVLLPFAVAATVSPATVYVGSEYVSSDPSASSGVWLDGQQVTNIYPYDAQGRPLTGVQLLDDYGRQVATTAGGAQDWSTFGEGRPLVPVVDVEGAVRWNAYPLLVQVGGGSPALPALPQPTLAPLVGAPSSAGSATPVPSSTSSPALPSLAPQTTSAEPTPTEVAPSPTATDVPTAEPTPTTTAFTG